MDTTGLENTSPSSPPDAVGVPLGTIIDGRYLLLAKLGEGGMGAVYRVEHVRMGKVMALKLLRPDAARRKSAVERFRREARVVSRLNHPNIITVFDCGETDSGVLYIVMEYVPGKDLSGALRDDGAFEERRALRIISQLLKGLADAHEAGIIHRDIKPGNVMLARSREETDLVKVLDFGIAKLAEGQREGGSKITGGADLVGTPSCMSPEQARGLELDRRSDLYSVSAMLFELVAGRGPFVGSPLEVVSQHLVATPPSIRSVAPGVPVSDALEALVAKGLSKDPASRFQSADEMRREVDRVLGAPATSVSQEAVMNIARREDWDAFERSFRFQHSLVRFGAVFGIAAAAAVGAFTYRSVAEQPVEPVPVTQEQEPNDKPAAANLIEAGKKIGGYIGARTTPGFSDRDLFEVWVMRESVFSLSVSAVPNINFVAEIFSEPSPGSVQANPIAAIDDAPVSMSEELTDLILAPGRYLVRLQDRRRLDEPDGPPRENSSDPYSLVVKLEEPRLFQEREPNNEPDEAMLAGFDVPVLAKAGTPGIVSVKRGGPEPLATWGIDVYRVQSPGGAKEECALIGGMRWTTLRLTAMARRDGRDRLKTLGSVQVREGRVGGVCAKAVDNLFFEVRVDVGSTGDATYPIAFIGDQAGGFRGLLALAEALPRLDRAAEARLMIERALELMPKSADAGAAREMLVAIPVGESTTAAEP